MFILTDEQQVALSVAYKTAAGNPARVDGVPVWTSSDPSIVSLIVAEDGLSAQAVSGALGSAQITVSADADLGEGVREILATLDIEVHAAEAIAAIVVAGTPELKPVAPAPTE